jgi:CBS domain-containing protein
MMSELALEKIRESPVGDFVDIKSASIRSDTSIEEILKLLKRRDIKNLPVVDSKGALIGEVIESDVMKIFISTSSLGVERLFGPRFDMGYFAKTARDIMRKHGVIFKRDMKIKNAAPYMIRHRLFSVPVVDDHGKLVGMMHAESLLEKVVER